MISNTRKELTLKEKFELLRYLDQGNSERKAAEHFGISKGSVGNIKQRRKEYITQYEDDNIPNDRKRKIKQTENEDINKLVWAWFQKARARNIPISGPTLQEVAQSMAEKLNKEFKGSNGWLESFRKRHQIEFQNLHGESASADLEGAANFLQRLEEMCQGYEPEDVFNADETGLFYKAIPKKSLVEKYKQSKGTKNIKDRITVLLASSATGEKLQPLVIGRSKKPRCFKNLSVEKLPVVWRSSRKAWMTGELFEEWLRKQNQYFASKSRKILLFVDNSDTHVKITLSNITVKCLPPNTTSLIQPLDQGIISNFKALYRKLLVRQLIAKMEANSRFNPTDVTVLDAVYWISQAWKEVSEACIKNCFRKAGFTKALSGDDEVLNEVSYLADALPSSQLIQALNGDITAQEYCTFDDNILTFDEQNEIDLVDQVFNEQYGNDDPMDIEQEQTSDADSEVDEEEKPCPTYKEVFEMVQQLKVFATTHEEHILPLIKSLETHINEIQSKRITSRTQTTLYSYFSSV